MVKVDFRTIEVLVSSAEEKSKEGDKKKAIEYLLVVDEEIKKLIHGLEIAKK